MSVIENTRNILLDPPRDADATALEQAEQYGLTTSWPPLVNDHTTEHSLNSHISNLAQNLPHPGDDIESTRRWLNGALDFRQTALKHPIAWTGAELHALSEFELGEYLVECGLGRYQARELARDVVFARQVCVFLCTRAAWLAKITKPNQEMIQKGPEARTENFKRRDTARMRAMLACLFVLVAATSIGLIL
ncbi:hypothetical protein CkaCkLH20_02003 [Colletotrichum karsti]|uniref:Uncharacterized protein n=1 Tax=Colletotrichum karsti TaxID=1095194 RepID=A0A9P6IFH7_9PEZI|nr:uncharacterized protein CkaCkLH20_02003 [Colletotrichum karsti]KAF9880961.1 hypothetical protein CkaCkLH20_02003 [Colletotrichum karsti]